MSDCHCDLFWMWKPFFLQYFIFWNMFFIFSVVGRAVHGMPNLGVISPFSDKPVFTWVLTVQRGGNWQNRPQDEVQLCAVMGDHIVCKYLAVIALILLVIISHDGHIPVLWREEKEGNILFNDDLNIFYFILSLSGVCRMVRDHSENKKVNPLLSHHGQLYPVSSKGSFTCTIHADNYIPWPLSLSWYMLPLLLTERADHELVPAGFQSCNLSGLLPYVWCHITVTVNLICWVHR